MSDMLDNPSFPENGDVVESVEENSTVPATGDTDTPAEVTPEPNTVESNVEETVDATTPESVTQTEEENKTVEEPVKPIPRSQKRIEELLSEKRELQDKLKTFGPSTEAIAAATRTKPQVNENGEVELTQEQLDAMIDERVTQQMGAADAARQQKELASAWDTDITSLMKGTPELDPDNAGFNESLSNSLVELIRIANTDDHGNATVRKLPSEIWNSLQDTISSAKTAGKTEASATLAQQSNNAAIQDSVSGEAEAPKYTDQQLEELQAADPRAYSDLIEKNLI